jgi:hypothetical protein
VEKNVKHHLRAYPGVWQPREGQFPRADFASLFNKHDKVSNALPGSVEGMHPLGRYGQQNSG